jgi:indolepyruvate ferredoxin oxidoreductase
LEARLVSEEAERAPLAKPPALRRPHFCSGCPHNRSTLVPEGSRASAGIGCHGLAALFMPNTSAWTQMGGEGVHWVGLSSFTDEPHVFANLGDGTYFHSGVLAIRQAVAAGVNITYKLLYNSAVAMTGGQSIDGDLSVETLVRQLHAEGVATVILLSEDPTQYHASSAVRQMARVGHRDDLEATQRELRETTGVSVIIYEQMCATEKRRQRKRGRLPEPAARVFINDLVCEGCGDCSARSNCLSVEPLETSFGVKRRINQSSCNKDMSCIDGFCPSFVTVEGGTPVRRLVDVALPELPMPVTPQPVTHERILVAGVGGTGVVTIGALVAMAAHIGNRKAAVLDQVGMAQKGGAVTSHIHIADEAITALRIPAGMADLVLVCDQIVGNAKDVIAAIMPHRTRVVANTDVGITGDFTRNRNAIAPADQLARRIADRAGTDNVLAYPFTRLSERLFGDAIGSNLMMLGAAWQRGWIRLDYDALEAAIDLNGQAPSLNRAAFAWGRRLATDPDAVLEAAQWKVPIPETLDTLIERRAAFLETYQSVAWADRYRATIARVREAEATLGSEALCGTAARSLFKLMAYKDEYEVARLFTEGRFADALKQQFDGNLRLRFHMAPPMLSKRDPVTGHLRKRSFGCWIIPVFHLLAKFRGLRGTWADPFGHTGERRAERALIGEYEAVLDRLVTELGGAVLEDAIAIAALPQEIRGYGHVKDGAIAAYRATVAERLARFGTGLDVSEPIRMHTA